MLVNVNGPDRCLENDHGRRELEDRHTGCFVALALNVHDAPGVYVTEADV